MHLCVCVCVRVCYSVIHAVSIVSIYESTT